MYTHMTTLLRPDPLVRFNHALATFFSFGPNCDEPVEGYIIRLTRMRGEIAEVIPDLSPDLFESRPYSRSTPL